MKHPTLNVKLLTFGVVFLCSSVQALTVFAAASTADAMKEVGALYTKITGETVRFNFAGSGALARQIDAGAPADLFLSANIKWMDYLEANGRIIKETRADLLANWLVLIEPRIDTNGHEKDVFEKVKEYKRLAVGDFKSVPAGAYAEQALKNGGVLDDLRWKLIKADNVRRVLFYVERGEVDAGIVYATDAKVSSKVKTVGVFPEELHEEIRYPVAVCTGSKDKSAVFLSFLKSTEARAVFGKYGFEAK